MISVVFYSRSKETYMLTKKLWAEITHASREFSASIFSVFSPNKEEIN